jgi:hypothetical protein
MIAYNFANNSTEISDLYTHFYEYFLSFSIYFTKLFTTVNIIETQRKFNSSNLQKGAFPDTMIYLQYIIKFLLTNLTILQYLGQTSYCNIISSLKRYSSSSEIVS